MKRVKLWKLIFALIAVQIFTFIGVCLVKNDEVAAYVYDGHTEGIVNDVRKLDLVKMDGKNKVRAVEYDYRIGYVVDDVNYETSVKCSERKYGDGEKVVVYYVTDEPRKAVLDLYEDSASRIGWIVVCVSAFVSLLILVSMVEVIVINVRKEIRRQRRRKKMMGDNNIDA